MNICYLENGIYKVNNEETPFEDLFTIQFYKNSNSLADAFYTGEVFDNILFANMIQKKLAIEFYLALNNVEKIEITEENIEIRNYTIDAAVSLGISVCGKNKKVSFIKQWIKMDGAMGYLFFKQLQNKYRNREVVFEKDVAVLRTPAAKGKIKKMIIEKYFMKIQLVRAISIHSSHYRQEIDACNWQAVKQKNL